MHSRVQFKTISKECSSEYSDKGSKFIAIAYPVADEKAIAAYIASVKSMHPKARHWCYAWKIVNHEPEFKCSDDGEPSGTAGKPILNQISSKDLYNVLVIVVRYFGGTLLGTSGLIKAYKTSSHNCLELAEQIQVEIENKYLVTAPVYKVQTLISIIKELNLKVLDFNLSTPANICFSIPISQEERLFGQIKSKLEKTNRDQLGDPYSWENCKIELC